MIWRLPHTVVLIIGGVCWVLLWFGAAAVIWAVFGRGG